MKEHQSWITQPGIYSVLLKRQIQKESYLQHLERQRENLYFTLFIKIGIS